jgi:hypothetical protein
MIIDLHPPQMVLPRKSRMLAHWAHPCQKKNKSRLRYLVLVPSHSQLGRKAIFEENEE